MRSDFSLNNNNIHGVLVTNPEKILYAVANPARGLLNRQKRIKRLSLAYRIEKNVGPLVHRV